MDKKELTGALKRLRTDKLVSIAKEDDWIAHKGKGAIYAIWGDIKLKGLLNGKILTMKKETKKGKKEINKDMSEVINRSAKRELATKDDLFCFYVGRSSDLKDRTLSERRFNDVLRFIALTLKGRKVINASDLKNNGEIHLSKTIGIHKFWKMIHVSSCPIENWEDRFFAEGYAIAMLRPVWNLRPE